MQFLSFVIRFHMETRNKLVLDICMNGWELNERKNSDKWNKIIFCSKTRFKTIIPRYNIKKVVEMSFYDFSWHLFYKFEQVHITTYCSFIAFRLIFFGWQVIWVQSGTCSIWLRKTCGILCYYLLLNLRMIIIKGRNICI